MTAKKNAINISIVMILLSLIIILLCWCEKDKGIPELLYVLASGVFGSSFATLWIFIYEYNKEKHELLSSIFQETTSITENEVLPYLDIFGFHAPEIKKYMQHKYYVSPVNADIVARMDKQDRCVYELSRFVDGILDIGYDRIKHICDLVENINFWSDSFRHGDKYKDAIVSKISLPLYEVFIAAPAMEDGYIFRYFKGFKTYYEYSAEQIYEFVCELDRVFHGHGGEVKYTWQKKNENLCLHVHEQLWIFRDAFFSPYVSRKERCEAIQAFLKNTSYYRIR